MDDDALRAKVAGLMPEILAELEAMVAIPSVAFPGFPPEPVHRMADRTVEALRRYGVDARLQQIPGGYPAVWADIPAPEGRPTVLLYAHYDVQPAPPEQGWTADPFEPVHRDGRIFGRGAADDTSGIAIHLATLAAFDGRPPVGVRVVFEGEEETISHLEDYVADHPERFAADAVIVADMGNLVVGEPVLTVGLRGHVKAVVEVRTLENPVHSGLFGGAAPDALMALVKLLARLTDDDGACAVPGLQTSEWSGAEYPEALLRANAGVLDGVALVGTGSIAGRLWSKPSVTVLGIDAPAVDTAGNVLHATARAVVAMRIPPGQDESTASAALVEFLRSQAGGDVVVEVAAGEESPAFAQQPGGRVFDLMRDALARSYDRPVGTVGSGGSIPLLALLRAASPDADFLLTGAEDAAASRIHGPDESVDPTEIERMAYAQALLLQHLAD